MLRENIAKRHDVFLAGLSAAGYTVSCGEPRSFRPGDALLIWNRRGHEEKVADNFERAGGVVFVAENCYVGRNYYALAKRYHNGGGEELVDDPSRASALGAHVAPWRTSGDHVLVCPNRFIGPHKALMPATWAVRTAEKLRQLTRREVRIRPHPGRGVPNRTLAEDLAGAWACVVWWSSAGVAALLAGVPVIYCAPWWIASVAAGRGLQSIEDPAMGDRLVALRRIGNSQFTPAEIAMGLPFRGQAQ